MPLVISRHLYFDFTPSAERLQWPDGDAIYTNHRCDSEQLNRIVYFFNTDFSCQWRRVYPLITILITHLDLGKLMIVRIVYTPDLI